MLLGRDQKDLQGALARVILKSRAPHRRITVATEYRQHEEVDGFQQVSTTFSKTRLVIALWRSRRKLGLAALVGMIIALSFTLLIPSQYESEARLMPPDQSALLGKSLIAASMSPAAAGSLLASAAGGGYFSGRTPGGIAIGILSSRTVLDAIVNRFNLRTVYHKKLQQDARKTLLKASTFTEDRKSGMMTITVIDGDPNRARDIVQAYVDQLSDLVSRLSTSSARREREFLDARLKVIKADLDKDSKALSEFSSRNATMDPARQGEATMSAAERLQAELIAAQSQLSALSAAYTTDNVRVRAARNRVDSLQRQLAKVTGGQGEIVGANSDTDAGRDLPSVREIPLLGLTYYRLYRQVQMEQAVYEVLTKQDEIAKVEEAEQIMPVKVLDEPQVPEKRESKHRAVFMLAGMFIALFLTSGRIVVREIWSSVDESHPAKAFVIELLHLKKAHKPDLVRQ